MKHWSRWYNHGNRDRCKATNHVGACLAPLLVGFLEKLAHESSTGACKDRLKDKLTSSFSRLELLGQKDKVELAYPHANAR